MATPQGTPGRPLCWSPDPPPPILSSAPRPRSCPPGRAHSRHLGETDGNGYTWSPPAGHVRECGDIPSSRVSSWLCSSVTLGKSPFLWLSLGLSLFSSLHRVDSRQRCLLEGHRESGSGWWKGFGMGEQTDRVSSLSSPLTGVLSSPLPLPGPSSVNWWQEQGSSQDCVWLV